MKAHQKNVEERIETLKKDDAFLALSKAWLEASHERSYQHNFSWLGIPIIQLPQDIMGWQEIIWHAKPDLIIETGVARGGSLIFHASMLALMDYADVQKRKVVGVDLKIRELHADAIRTHPMGRIIELIEGDAVDAEVIARIKSIAEGFKSVMVVLDSNHSYEHVWAELQAYAPLISAGSYLVVMDTCIGEYTEHMFENSKLSKYNNPKTAVIEFLKTHPEFEVDTALEKKLMITAAPHGYLRRKE